MPLPDVVRDWHDLLMLFGTASATLIGLLFVAASVGSGAYSADKRPALRSFLSPTVVHFACVLVGCLVALAPLRSWGLFGALIGGDGLFGVAYAATVWRCMVHHGLSTRIDLEDRTCYAVPPAVGYAVMAAAGVTLLLGMASGCGVLAVAMGLLLLVGIRNAWDITVWTVARRPE